MGADVVKKTEGSTEAPRWPGVEVPPGSESRACTQWGSPGTWEGLPPPHETRERGKRVKKTPGLRRLRLAGDGSKRNERTERYRQAKATKCGGKDGRQSERPVVLAKPGNRPTGTRWREGDAGSRNV